MSRTTLEDRDRELLLGKNFAHIATYQADGRPSVVPVQNLDNPYEYVQIRGRVAGITPDGGEQHIDKMARKYLGRDTYPDHREDDPRHLVRVQPESVRRHGS